jgi:peroxiredoxin
MPRVALNAPAPDFTLKDFRGEQIKLSDFKERSNVLLVFNRGFI